MRVSFKLNLVMPKISWARYSVLLFLVASVGATTYMAANPNILQIFAPKAANIDYNSVLSPGLGNAPLPPAAPNPQAPQSNNPINLQSGSQASGNICSTGCSQTEATNSNASAGRTGYTTGDGQISGFYSVKRADGTTAYYPIAQSAGGPSQSNLSYVSQNMANENNQNQQVQHLNQPLTQTTGQTIGDAQKQDLYNQAVQANTLQGNVALIQLEAIDPNSANQAQQVITQNLNKQNTFSAPQSNYTGNSSGGIVGGHQVVVGGGSVGEQTDSSRQIAIGSSQGTGITNTSPGNIVGNILTQISNIGTSINNSIGLNTKSSSSQPNSVPGSTIENKNLPTNMNNISQGDTLYTNSSGQLTAQSDRKIDTFQNPDEFVPNTSIYNPVLQGQIDHTKIVTYNKDNSESSITQIYQAVDPTQQFPGADKTYYSILVDKQDIQPGSTISNVVLKKETVTTYKTDAKGNVVQGYASVYNVNNSGTFPVANLDKTASWIANQKINVTIFLDNLIGAKYSIPTQ